MSIGIIILAAGSSTRMGKPKQLLPVEGESLLHRATRTALRSKARIVVVVLGANEEDHRRAIKDLGADVIENPDWEKGMGSSLKAGLKYLSGKDDISAVVIMVCDQPSVTSEHLDQLIDTHELTKKLVVASQYSGFPGVPALISRDLFDELKAIDDTNGAKKVIQGHLHETALVTLHGGEIDLDTPDEYQNYIGRK
jgi:molybdenum cofactor cytidylyltransferase